MKIDNIVLYNFGSYEGEAIFDTRERDGRNIIIIGGKNGAGKTTLFTAIRVCLYGYMSMGYRNMNSFYTRAISRMINNTAKMSKPANAHVSVQIALSNGHGVDCYILKRSWLLSDSFSERFNITRNGVLLNENEASDFEKYILSLIPPELFNLYFFDGEKIADFFMNEGSNVRIKDAFLTVCGYDTFDIMRKNFKRIGTGTGNTSPALEGYLAAKDDVSFSQQKHNGILAQLNTCITEIEDCEAAIAALEQDYSLKGGITQEEWNNKLIALKEEEKKRENINLLLRKWANEVVPFLMIREQIIAVKQQIQKENNNLKYRNFCEIIENSEIQRLLGKSSCQVKNIAFTQYGSNEKQILDLSFEQSAAVMAQIENLLSFDSAKIKKYKNAIKRSISTSAKLRQELHNSSIATVQEYMKRRAQMFENKSELLNEQVKLERAVVIQSEVVKNAEANLIRIRGRLEEEIKKASISDISAKAIIMLDELQANLYRQQINKVEQFFCKEIRVLMRKTHFIDDIRIDDAFNIHIYRKDKFDSEKLLKILESNSLEQLKNLLGDAAFEKLERISKTNNLSDFKAYCATLDGHITLPVEIDKASLSNGEKQIFIMAFYHSLVQLCNHEIPFIIDTPFARIDTEHRMNISKHFFRKLNGQVFILSTNEEIDSTHMQILRDKISATYTLENTDNKKTVVFKDTYFEVNP